MFYSFMLEKPSISYSHFKKLPELRLEMLYVLVALRIFTHYWCMPKGHVRCNNLAVGQVLQRGKTRISFPVCAHAISGWRLLKLILTKIFSYLKGA